MVDKLEDRLLTVLKNHGNWIITKNKVLDLTFGCSGFGKTAQHRILDYHESLSKWLAIERTITDAKVTKGKMLSKLAVKKFVDMYRQSTPSLRLRVRYKMNQPCSRVRYCNKFIIELVFNTPLVFHIKIYIKSKPEQYIPFNSHQNLNFSNHIMLNGISNQLPQSL